MTNEHQGINIENLIERYKKESLNEARKMPWCVRGEDITEEHEKIEYLSTNIFETIFVPNSETYYIGQKKDRFYVPITKQEAQPKSARERLHNIEENKSFHQKQAEQTKKKTENRFLNKIKTIIDR